jgi:prevent-host-death family protein
LPTVRIRDLANKTSAVVDEVDTSGQPVLATKRGKPVAAVVPIDQDALDDWALANAPDFVKARHDADRDLATGRARRWLMFETH